MRYLLKFKCVLLACLCIIIVFYQLLPARTSLLYAGSFFTPSVSFNSIKVHAYLFFNCRQKLCSGSFQYGSTAYVINPMYADKMFMSPFDTGESNPPNIPWGTPDYFFHLIQPHLDHYKYKDLTPIFQRWYNWGPRMNSTILYFEGEMSANVWFPEAVLYVIAYFKDTWGTKDGETMQTYMQNAQRPLVWANGADSGGSFEK